MLAQYTGIVDLIETAVRTAWSFESGDKLHREDVMIEQTSFPYAVIRLAAQVELRNANAVVDDVVFPFEIVGRFKRQAGTPTLELQMELVAKLRKELLAVDWSAYGHLPMVPSALDPDSIDSPGDRYFEVDVGFVISTQSDRDGL